MTNAGSLLIAKARPAAADRPRVTASIKGSVEDVRKGNQAVALPHVNDGSQPEYNESLADRAGESSLTIGADLGSTGEESLDGIGSRRSMKHFVHQLIGDAAFHL
jgi:hypothetical protein